MGWITDRLPTEADADEDGDVEVPHACRNWLDVRPGEPWAHVGQNYWNKPPAKPALAVGQRWRRRDGRVVIVDGYNENHPYGETHPFWAESSSYTKDGMCGPSGKPGHELDLVELIKPAPAADLTPRRFVFITRSDGYLDAIADDGTAWWMVPSQGDHWIQHPPLPDSPQPSL